MKNLRRARRERREREDVRATRRGLAEALDRIEELEKHLDAVKKLRGAKKPRYSIKPKERAGTSEAVAFAMATDWHIGSVIKPEQVNGKNEYSVPIARARARRFFERVVKLTNKERQDVKIHELVLFLGGDFLDGAIHLDTVMVNEPSTPMEQAVIAQTLIEEGLEHLKPHYEKITVVCADGNHGRVSNRLHHSSRKGNALEWYMYHNLAQRHPNLNWVLEGSLLTYMDVMGHTVRFLHGDPIHFGGVNGFYTYLHRRIFQWDKARAADLTILGHLHSYCPNRRYVVNGSLVGYSPFAVSLGALYEPPIQAFFLLDKKRGVSVTIPILVEE